MQIPKIILLISFLLMPIPLVADECNCTWQGPFSWLTDEADVVALVRIGSKRGNSVDVVIDDLVKGKEFESVVRIWGDYQHYCRANTAEFPEGSRWLFALSRINNIPEGGFNPNTPNKSYGRLGDYSLSRCGAYWLKEKNGSLTGNITSVFEWDYAPDMEAVPYDVVKAFVQGKATYKDIIEHSEEVTSKEAMLRRSKKALDFPRAWE